MRHPHHPSRTTPITPQILAGLKESGVEATLYQVAETLPQEVQDKMHIKPLGLPLATPEVLAAADGFIFGFPTRFGSLPAQFKAFLDSTGGLWMKGALDGKSASVFVSTASQHGGQETTTLTMLPWFVHHGISFVPLGPTVEYLGDLTEVIGGSPWGAATIAGADGSRAVSDKEKAMALYQGKRFGQLLKR
jgi:NAD(P)H dehydrogenase (quinone)